MEKFETFKELSDYIENNYGEEEQIIIDDFISYYLNEYRGFGKHNCQFTYKENIQNDETGELHKLALIGFEFLKKNRQNLNQIKLKNIIRK
jgi:hypothetical protein